MSARRDCAAKASSGNRAAHNSIVGLARPSHQRVSSGKCGSSARTPTTVRGISILDLNTLQITGIAVSLPLAVMLRLGVPPDRGSRSPVSRSLHLWWYALVTHALFWIFYVALERGPATAWASLVNSLSVLAMALYVEAITTFLGRERMTWAVPATLAVVVSANLLFSLVVENIAMRVVSVSLVGAAWFAHGCRCLWQSEEAAIGRPRSILIVVLALTTLVLLSRTLEIVLVGPRPFDASAAQQAALLAFALLPIFASLGFFLMIGNRANARLESRAACDDLTGTLNRRAFLQAARSRLQQSLDQTAEPATLLLLDLDHFKQINDTLGHAAGDEALRAFCAMLGENLRDDDLIGRLGGEEFAVLLPGADQAAGRAIAEKLRQATREIDGEFGGAQGALSVSIGVAEWDRRTVEMNPLLKRADEAMYAAKRAGRDRVEVAARA